MAAILFGVFYGAYHGPWDPRYKRRMNERMGTAKSAALSHIEKDKITLNRGQPLVVGKSRLVFHGIEKNRIHVAVYLLELDPEVPYHHQIPIKEAKRELRLGGQDYVLVSHARNRIQLRTR